MSRPPDRREGENPATHTGFSQRVRDQALTKSPTPTIPSLSQPGPTPADLATPIVALIAELRPDIPLSVAASLVVECLDLSACMILDGEWARARQAIWPEAIRAAHSRHAGQSYADRHRGYREAS
jgi:hypothetical protein